MKSFFTKSISKTLRVFMLCAAIIIAAIQANAQITVTATAGTLGPTVYTQLRLAFNAINAGTHRGVINISVTANTTETAVAMLRQSGTGAANYTSVSIKPAPGTNPIIDGSELASFAPTGAIYLNGASNVTIDGSNTVGGTTQNLTIQNLNINGQYNIRFSGATNSASNDVIKNCIITGAGAAYGIAITSGGPVYQEGVFACNNNTIQNNTITNSQTGFYCYGPAGMDNGWTITGNNMSNLGFSGIVMYDISNANVSYNIINGVAINAAFNVSGILFSYNVSGANIYGNQINNINNYGGPGTDGAQGIYMDIPSAGDNVNIYNNYVSNVYAVADAGVVVDNGHGIYVDWGDGINIYANSINMATSQGGGITAGLCFDPFSTVTNINVVDNISVNSETGGGQYAIYNSGSSSMFGTINYNDYYSSGNLGFLGVNCNTIAAIQTNFGGNLNSITMNPTWVSSSDLDLTAVASNNALNAGIFITTPSITIDLRGNTRTTPTIGAFELVSNSITYTALSNTCSNGDITLSPVTITSGVGVPTTGATVPRIYFKKNAGAWFSNAGTLSAGTGTSGTWSFTITAATLGGVTAGDVISYYVIAQTTGATVFSTPSTGLVATSVNSVTTPPTTPNTYTVNYTSLTGLTTTGSVCYNATTAQTVPYAYTGSTGTPNQYTLTWAPAGPTAVTTYAALSSPINVNIPAGTAANTYTGTLTVQNSTTLCTNTYTITVTVNPLPAAISGTTTICQGTTVTLSDTPTPGTWLSSNPAAGTIGSTTGVLGGIAAGTTNITYTITGTGCTISTVATIVTSPGVINGTMSMCQGASTTLTDAVLGGVWSNVAGSGTVTNVGGTITGGLAGTATISYSFGGGLCYQTAIVTVNASPGPITGTPASVCVGLTTPLSDAIPGGTWSSSNPAAGTVSTTGVVTGIGVGGTTMITYTMPGNCYVTTIVTVNPAPSPINGSFVNCQGTSTTLSDAVGGGTWSSSNPGVGSISSPGGIIVCLSGGTTTITYTSANCTPVTQVVTVNPVAVITGSLTVCSGLSTQLTDAIAGTWTSSNLGVAIVGSSSGLVIGLGAGTSTIITTFPTGCSASAVVTVNPSPLAIVGTSTLCYGNTTTFTDPTAGGTWASSTGTIATIVTTTGVTTAVSTTGGTTTITYTLPAGCIATTTLTVNPVPTPILGTLNICQGLSSTLTDATPGGGWISSNPVGMPVGSASGTVTGISIGTAVISYILPTGCSATAVVTVNTSPNAIDGNHSLCLGTTTTLTDPTGGGTWSSSNPGVGSIGSTTGVLGGMSVNTATITYTLPAGGCTATTTITVNPLPAAISGTLSSCAGVFTQLSDASAGGTWSSSNPTVATIGSNSGLVDALATGTTTILYSTVTTGCSATAVFTVNPSPVAIAGTPNICQGSSFAFNDGTAGGTWSSSNTTYAVVGSTGIVGGVNPGAAVISYTLPTTCYAVYPVNITTPPTPITGPSVVCVSSAIALSDGVSGGIWNVTLAGPGVASISTTGIVTGISSGVVGISYTTFACPPALYAVTVNPLPDAITGVGNLCVGSSTSLTDASTGGTWSSSDTTASVSSTGVVSGVDTGSGTIISYTLPTGCFVTVPVIVFPIPDSIKGVDSVCQGTSLFLSDNTPGGVWSSSDGTIARSIAFTGEVDGLVAGNVHISYTLISGCYVTVPFKVIEPLPASVTITQTLDSTKCSGQPDTLIAHPVNGGTPTFEWDKFGAHFQYGDTLIYPPIHGDYITCIMTSHDICSSPAEAQTSLVMNVYPLVAPTVVVSTTGGDTTAYVGDVYTFYTDVTNGGVNPGYQWSVNNVPVAGATNSTFTTHVYNNDITVTCTVTGNSPCDTGSLTGTSAPLTIYGLGYLSVNTVTTGGNDLSLFPNPNAGSFILSGKLSAVSNKNVSLAVADMLGRTVYTGETTPQNGSIHAEIKLDNDIAAGTYLLRVNTESGTETFHFVIGK